MGAFLLGPFIIKYEWFILLVAALVSYFILRWATKAERSFQVTFMNIIGNAVMIAILTFKFSYVLFHPTVFLTNPKAILYFAGGLKGAFLGAFLAFIYLSWNYKKGSWPLKQWIAPIVYGIVTFFIAFWLLRTLFFILT
ncbi:hypothetical protein BGM26_04930 [Bacillus sp. FJAT-29790]|uniref:hypothetical protein n=1 Tax=Bacillus sp. FJAT-29790 TaxID=1895002 RepID=UPI001C22DB21|nr:hypothetical protein [Bacillus sp. FJAT-29790]MBU8878331.1 hypothetical protein [Bacillus sp. FJAT-29790]